MNTKTNYITSASKYASVLAILIVALSSCTPTKYLAPNDYWLYKQNIHFENFDTEKSNIEKKKIKKYYRLKTNKLLFGLPVPVYFYNTVTPQKEALREIKRLPKDNKKNARRQIKNKEPRNKFYITRWLLKIGEPLAVFNDYDNYKTKENIVNYLKTKGYYYATVTDSFEIIDRKMWLTYRVQVNEPYVIDSFYYEIENENIYKLLIKDSANLKIKKGIIFDSDLLKNERLRITKYLKSNSYFLFQKEHIRFYADTNKLDKKVKLKLSILSPNGNDEQVASYHKQFKINNLHVYLGYDPRDELVAGKEYLDSFDKLKFNSIIFHYKGKSVFDPNVILRGLYIKGDSLYNFDDVEKTYLYLNNLHTFKLINIGFKNTTSHGFIRDTEDSYGMLDCIIKLTPAIKQSYSLEGEANISSYGDYGAAANIGYKNLNLWRKAIALDINTKAARENIYIEKNGVREIFKVNIIGGNINLLFPKFLSPRFLLPVKLDRFDNKYKPKTNLFINADYQERYDYTNLISTFGYGYKWQTSEYASHFFSLAEFSTTKVFNIREEYIDFVFKNDIWSSFFDNIILGLNYQYLFTNHNQTVYDNAYFLRFGIEASGNLLAGLNSTLDLGTAQIPYSDRYAKSIFGLPYFQFVKLDFEYRKYKVLANNQQLVFRGLIGVGIPYGNLDFMPIQKQYYAGGANSIRAWPPKRLGPGSLNAEEVLSTEPSVSYNNIFQNADMKIEVNLENRFKIISKIDGALFIDAGNIWSLSESKFKDQANFEFNRFYKEIAVGTGVGIRLNFDFFIIRIDLGIKLLDPVLVGSKWAWKSSNTDRSNFNFNFSIGYPF